MKCNLIEIFIITTQETLGDFYISPTKVRLDKNHCSKVDFNCIIIFRLN